MIKIFYTDASNTYPNEDPSSITIAAASGFPLPVDLAVIADDIETQLLAAGQQVQRRTTTTTTSTTQVPEGTQAVTETTVLTGPWVGAQA